MDKYEKAQNPPSIFTEIRFWSLIALSDLLALGGAYFVTNKINQLFHLSSLMGIINYLFVFMVVLFMIRKPRNNPEERYYKLVLYSFFMDKNKYHSL